MTRIYQKIGVVEKAVAVVITPIFKDCEVSFRMDEIVFPMFGEFVLN